MHMKSGMKSGLAQFVMRSCAATDAQATSILPLRLTASEYNPGLKAGMRQLGSCFWIMSDSAVEHTTLQ